MQKKMQLLDIKVYNIHEYGLCWIGFLLGLKIIWGGIDMQKYPIICFEEADNAYDDSVVIQKGNFQLDDSRQVNATAWAESGYTFLTYIFSIKDIETLSKNDLTEYLISQGISLDKDKFGDKVSILSGFDSLGNKYWNYTITVGESDD